MPAIPAPGPLAQLADEIAAVNRANGWFDAARTFGDDCALIHSEVSEAFEEFRAGHHPAHRYYSGAGLTSADPEGVPHPKPEGVPSELADVLVRVLDTAYRYGIDLDLVLAEKLAYNATRGRHHGGKLI